jgi:opacity protein-like surface antigen
MKIINALVAAALLVTGISLAQAQEPSTSNVQATQTQTFVAGNAHSEKRHDDGDQTRYPSGFNTGPTRHNVEGCVGPVSYCNIYFGS